MKLLCCLILLFSCLSAKAQLYKDSTQSVEVRVNDLLNRMTLEEKFWQTFMIPADLDSTNTHLYKNGIFGIQMSASAQGDAGGQLLNYSTSDNAITLAKKINAAQHYFVEETRLGIPIIPFDEALHGLVRSDATSFPQAIAMAATWDTTLIRQATGHIANESKARGIRQILSPVINLATDVRWGRTEETYGEDPFLTSQMGLCFVKSFEELGIITTPKHFVANVGDGGRDSYPTHLSERALELSHFIPFKTVIQQGGARSIMTAYNSLNGYACSSNSWLLTEKLKKEWGFDGFVISDANAVGGEVVLHNTADSYAASGAHAVNAGLDVIFQTEYKHYNLFYPAFADGSVKQAQLDDAVKRVLRAKFELGLFENPYIPEKIDETRLHEIGDLLALKVAQESFVLLKNEKQTLPLNNSLKTIAVFGADATEARLGGYSGPGFNKVSILNGIKEAVSDKTTVLYSEGANRNTTDYEIIDAQFIPDGFSGSYYNNRTFEGSATVIRTDAQINFHWTLFGPAPELRPDFYSVRWSGELIAPSTGTFNIGLEGNDGYRLYIDDKLVIDRWSKQSYHTDLTAFQFKKGKHYQLKVEFFESQGEGKIKLVWDATLHNDWQKKIDESISLAKKADVAVVVVGITEGEFLDRALLRLPGHQEELINSLAKTGKPIVVLLVGGSAITMESWINNADAIGMVWYPGQEGGHAIADVLFGDVNPAGRLPITFPMNEAQLPLVYNHEPTGRGNDYNNLSGQPLFPFGFGLSYTQFHYSDIVLENDSISTSQSTILRCTVKNVGEVDGDEVIQLYIQDILSSVVRPVQELKGFQRIHLKAGEEKIIQFEITPEMLAQLDQDLNSVVEAGNFRLMIGASSKDLRLKTILTIK